MNRISGTFFRTDNSSGIGQTGAPRVDVAPTDHDALEAFQSDLVAFTRFATAPFSQKISPLPTLGGLVIVADARLDNRSELFSELGIGELSSGICDEELLLHCYRQWGEGAPEHLLGDFAFAIWDEEAKRLCCARDHLGIKSLYYCLTSDQFVFANTIQSLLLRPSVSNNFSEEAVAIYLSTGALCHPERTFYDSIKKLPAATTLTVTRKDKWFKRYWDVEHCPKLESCTSDEYASQLRHLLEDSVNTRLRSECAVGAHLSGGLDSSAIVSLAMRGHGSLAKTYSWVPPAKREEEAASPEWAAAATMVRAKKLSLTHVEFDGTKMLDLLQKLDIAGGDTVDLWYEYVVREDAVSQGIGVILSGWGGDQFISNYGVPRYAETFWRAHPLETLKELKKVSNRYPHPRVKFIRMLVSQLITQPVSNWWKQASRKTIYDQYDLLSCCHDEFRSTARKHKKQRPISNPFSVRSALLWEHRIGHLLNRVESWAAAGQMAGVEYRYPLLDKRVVEFALGIPVEQYRKGGIGRFIFRSAVSDILPQDICWGNLKMEPARVAAFEAAQLEAVICWRREFGARTATNPWIDLPKLTGLIDQLQRKEITDPMKKRVAIRTALQSILVLNMGSSDAQLHTIRD